jgi:hypothetical protein
MTANYTTVKSKIDYLVSPTSTMVIRDDLLNLSPESWNRTLYYDDGRFSSRARDSVVVYNHTGREFLAGVRFKY